MCLCVYVCTYVRVCVYVCVCDILQGLTGNLTEKRVGVFEADLVQRIDDDEKL
jgi:hypothetical protein